MNQRPYKLGRRKFLASAAAAVGAPYVIPSGVLAAAGRPGANDRLTLAHIGVGGMGGCAPGRITGIPQHGDGQHRGCLRGGQQSACGSCHESRRELSDVYGLPPTPRAAGHRCGRHRFARSLACRADGARLPGWQARVRREAGQLHGGRRPRDGRGGAQARPRGAGRFPGSFGRAGSSGLHVPPQRHARQGAQGHVLAHGESRRRPDAGGATSPRTQLGPVARPVELAAVHSGRVSSRAVPLGHGIGRRRDSRPRCPRHERHSLVSQRRQPDARDHRVHGRPAPPGCLGLPAEDEGRVPVPGSRLGTDLGTAGRCARRRRVRHGVPRRTGYVGRQPRRHTHPGSRKGAAASKSPPAVWRSIAWPNTPTTT